MKRVLVLALLTAACGSTPGSGPGVPPVITPVPTPAVNPQYYAQNTPEQTRAAHRQAVELLKASKWTEAFAAIDTVQPRELRRSLTEYLQLVAAVRLPEEALFADGYAKALSEVGEGPALLNDQRKSLNQHRAWIAAIQDVMADEAVARNFQRPLPQNLQGIHNGTLIAAWESRGFSYDSVTYNATKAQFRAAASTLDGRIAMGDIFRDISAFNLHEVLFVDLTPFRFNSQPPLVLPTEASL